MRILSSQPSPLRRGFCLGRHRSSFFCSGLCLGDFFHLGKFCAAELMLSRHQRRCSYVRWRSASTSFQLSSPFAPPGNFEARVSPTSRVACVLYRGLVYRANLGAPPISPILCTVGYRWGDSYTSSYHQQLSRHVGDTLVAVVLRRKFACAFCFLFIRQSKNTGIRIFWFTYFSSVFVHTKHTSNMAECYDNDTNDVTAPEVYMGWEWHRCVYGIVVAIL